jgi:hypothetical protein
MAFVTFAEARAASRAAGILLAESELRESASTPRTATFDVFLSHSSEDADIIAGVKAILERDGLSVYVDWLEDPQADRRRVTPETARLLRDRMNHCKFLLYASSSASRTTKWMPWELGYFDGNRPGRVGVLPLVASAASTFQGQEYLGLYPPFEDIRFEQLGWRLGRRTGPGRAETLASLAR